MISIVVSSYKPDLFYQFEENVSNTIGVPYEIIKIDNPGLMGICEAYNLGAAKAKYDYVCFSHEDIIFLTQDWGYKVHHWFATYPEYGILGIAGSKYKSSIASGWASRSADMDVHNLIHGNPNDNTKDISLYLNPENSSIKHVLTLDGVWLCVRKSILKICQFDEKTFTKFHCYDLDFCIQIFVQTRYKAAVIFNVMIKHYSAGNFNQEWFTETIKLQQKWEKLLPLCTEEVSRKKKKEIATLLLFHLKAKVLQLNLNSWLYYSQLWKVSTFKTVGFVTFLKYNVHLVTDKLFNKQYDV